VADDSPRALPTDTPLLGVLQNLEAEGYTAQFRLEEGAVVRCLTCRDAFGADEIDADRATRLEGASDPADMLLVVPTACPRCGALGTVVANYGPEASIEEAEALSALERTPREGSGDIATPGVGT
jgi:hypothetical protein